MVYSAASACQGSASSAQRRASQSKFSAPCVRRKAATIAATPADSPSTIARRPCSPTSPRCSRWPRCSSAEPCQSRVACWIKTTGLWRCASSSGLSTRRSDPRWKRGRGPGSDLPSAADHPDRAHDDKPAQPAHDQQRDRQERHPKADRPQQLGLDCRLHKLLLQQFVNAGLWFGRCVHADHATAAVNSPQAKSDRTSCARNCAEPPGRVQTLRSQLPVRTQMRGSTIGYSKVILGLG